jgi:hypothetical protein
MRALVAMVGLALLAGCAPGPAGSFTDTSSAAYRMKSYYERNATERLGQCNSLIFEDVLRTEVLEETDQQIVVQVRYAYTGSSMSATGVVGGCDGCANGVFTLAKTAEGPQGTDMSDPVP